MPRATRVFGAQIAWLLTLITAASIVAAQDLPPDLFPKDKPMRFFVTLALLASLGGGGKVGLMWSVTRPWQHQLGQLALSVTCAMGVAFYGWNRYDATSNMAAAVFAAPLFDVVFDVVSRMWGRLASPPMQFPGPRKEGEP